MADNENTTVTEAEVAENQVEDTTNTEEENAAIEEQTEEKIRTMTEAEFSKAMDNAVAKGRRLGKKDALKVQKDAPVQDKTPSAAEDTTAQEALNARIQKANEKMLHGTAMGLASEVGLTAKGIKAAIRLYSDELAECFDDNEDLVEDDVKDTLVQFVEEYPEFKVATSDAKLSTPYSKRSGGSKLTPEDKLAAALGIK